MHFFWGAFDLAVSRFNGRRAPPRKAPIDRDAYDEEVISLGFWPGDPWTGATEAMFYSYTVPEPPGLAASASARTARVFSDALKEFLLPYEDVRRSPDPAQTILEFAAEHLRRGLDARRLGPGSLAYP